MKTNVIEQDESEKTYTKRRTWTEGFKTGMANIMWIVMNVRPAESRVEGGGEERRGGITKRKQHERTPVKSAAFLLCTAARHCK